MLVEIQIIIINLNSEFQNLYFADRMNKPEQFYSIIFSYYHYNFMNETNAINKIYKKSNISKIQFILFLFLNFKFAHN